MRAFTSTFTKFLVIVSVVVAISSSFRSEARSAESPAAEAEQHLRKACEIVWAGATPYKIDHCTKRAMAALADENRLRDNELKRMLIASERELETCTQALSQARGQHADVAAARQDPDPW